MKYTSVSIALGALCLAMPAQADPLSRPFPAAGSVIARKSGEEVHFVDVSGWRYVDLQQDLLSGDVLRTNATGQLAVLFSDRTQVRLGRNTSLLVKRMGGGSDTGLELQSGTIWARAERGGQGVVIDTPAAAAAIRGTDWTMTVGADGKTSLIVLEGLVELSNAQGSVKVAQGEGAVAAIGQAPSKIVVVNSKDREQMLYNLSLREAFNLLPVSTLSGADMRRERQRISAIAADNRSAEDWLTLAEVQLAIDGRQAASASLAKARTRRLSSTQIARSNLVDAFIAGANNQYRDAALLFDAAITKLDPKRRSIAEYGRYYARSLDDPKRVEKPPARATGPYAAVAEAYTAAFLQDIPTAVALLKKAEAKYPDNALIPAARARIVLLLDDREQMREATERSLAIDPEQAIALDARANYLSSINGDNEGALADLRAALASEPGNDMIWNSLGLVQGNRNARREAEKAFLQAIALDPQDPLPRVNLAILYLQDLRIEEARQQIDLARKADPNFGLTFIAQGSYDIHTGQMGKAVSELLAGAVSNPGYAQGQLLLAIALYDQGDRQAVEQALDNADRLDPNDPLISSVRTAISIDDYDADGAIRNAQEFLKRSRAAGGEFAALSASQDAGSVLNDAFRLQGLDAWGQYYGDAVFDPFTSSSYIDQYVHGSVNPFANNPIYGGNGIDYVENASSYSSFLQGLMLDPHILANSERKAALIRYPFVEASLTGGFNINEGETAWTKSGQVQGYSNLPFPVSFFGNLQWEKTPLSGTYMLDAGSFAGETKVIGGNGYVTATPAPDDRLVAYFNRSKGDFLFDAQLLSIGSLDRDEKIDSTAAGIGWSHTFAYENILNAGFFYSDQQADMFRSLDNPSAGGFSDENSSQKTYLAAINHTVATGDLTWRYGIEGGFSDVNIEQNFSGLTASSADRIGLGRAYLDVLHDIGPDLKAEYALFGTYIDSGNSDARRIEPRAGLAWTPIEGQWLRAAYMRQSYDFGAPTLSPVGMVGIQPNQFGLSFDGYGDTLAFRWDAQWTDRLFTAVDYQHQELHGLSIAYPGTAPIPLLPSSIDLSEGRIDRFGVTTNIALGNGFGLSASIAHTSSEDRDPLSFGFGDNLPFVPEKSAQIALTWVNEANIKATVAGNYTGQRDTGQKYRLDGYWTLDADLSWESPDKRVELDFAAYNLLDEDFALTPLVPGWGRAFKGSLTVRF
ncbi:FecR domain-containing protein [Pararhizobium sp.]|uniref:FecR domain-containing protein n=1 Tax=Pararhizobium sp. TaxID=1977563 RepID=UPI003D0C2575